MSWARPATRLLMVVTFLVATLALASTGALAHAGHNHAVQPETGIALEPVSVQKFSLAPVVRNREQITEMRRRVLFRQHGLLCGLV